MFFVREIEGGVHTKGVIVMRLVNEIGLRVCILVELITRIPNSLSEFGNSY